MVMKPSCLADLHPMPTMSRWMIDLKSRLAAALIEHRYPIVGCLHEANRSHCASVHYPRRSPSARRENRDNSRSQGRSLGSLATV